MVQSTKSKTLLSVAIGIQHRVIPEEETVRIVASSDEDTERHSILVLAVEHAFDPERDRIIYEADLVAGSAGFRECAAGIIKPLRSGMSAALGFAAARDRLQQKHCVVLVSHAAATDSTLLQLERRAGEDLARCVIVAPISPGNSASHTTNALRRFEARGGQVLNLTSSRNLLELAAGFQHASNRLAPCLVLIDPLIAPEWQSQTERQRTGPAPVGKEAIAERVLQSSLFLEIGRFTRQDHRATPVLFSSERPWETKLLEEFGARALLLGDEDVGESLRWCAALAQGGCQPIVVLNAEQFAKHADALRSDVFSLEQRATVIVLDAVSNSVNTLPSVLAKVPLVLPGTPDEVLPLAKSALRADGPRLLYLPLVSDLYAAERDRWLDFRAAAALRERAGKVSRAGRLPLMLGDPERESRQIQHLHLTPDMEHWVNEYNVVGPSDPVGWRHTWHAIQLLELPSVDPGRRRSNRDTKFLAAIFQRLLDRLTDEPDCDVLLQQLLRLPQGERPEISATDPRARHAALAEAVWNEFWRRARNTPRYDEFSDLLQYDFRQLCNTIEYSDLVLRQPEMKNAIEHAMYSPQGMLVTCAATLDLMCSPGFDANELGPLREAVWHAACMARYGDATTNRRRLRGDTVTANGGLTRTAVQMFLNHWQIHRACLLNQRERVSSCCLRSYVDGLDRLLASQHAGSPAERREYDGGGSPPQQP